jgi:SRSO17 transposase
LPPVFSLEAVARQLPASAWRPVTWRTGTRGPMGSRFALVEVWAAHGWKRHDHPPRVAEWLLIEWPEAQSAPTDYWLWWRGTHATRPSWREVIHAAKGRWKIEQDYRELKDELGLDHFEGRSWQGWHHHVTLVSLAFAFLHSEQTRSKKNFWCDAADDASAAPSRLDPYDGSMPVVPDHF